MRRLGKDAVAGNKKYQEENYFSHVIKSGPGIFFYKPNDIIEEIKKPEKAFKTGSGQFDNFQSNKYSARAHPFSL